MRDPVAFLLFVSLLAIVFPKGNQGYDTDEYEQYKYAITTEFAELDTNRDKYIDTEELSIDYKPPYIKYTLEAYDADGDGKMNFEEFKEMWLNWDNTGLILSEISETQKSRNENVLDRK